MRAIGAGETGPAIEDIQQRLTTLGYVIGQDELRDCRFGPTTLRAVRAFRNERGIEVGDVVDDQTWLSLVNATYKMGDRTLYLHLPYLQGSDVSHLQMTLNVLGFSCGEVDGLFGPHTEAAVREFQSNSGLFPDGMAFQDTFDAIERLHHVWMGKTDGASFGEEHVGLARAIDVLEYSTIVGSGDDQISRNVVSRMWNVALATTNDAHFRLAESFERARACDVEGADAIIMVTTHPREDHGPLPEGELYVVADSLDMLSSRVFSALRSSKGRPYRICVELSYLNSYDGTVTNRDVQSAAITMLDALCSVLNENAQPK